MVKVFIDGQEGTTGLEIRERLERHSEIRLLEIAADRRKDSAARKTLINEADVVITCLPDAAAREAVSLVENANTRVIDPSTAHRTSDEWAYGFPELSPSQRDRIRTSHRVTVPGCHATGLVAALRPLVVKGIVPPDYPVVVQSLTGYSGGGKKRIQSYQAPKGPVESLRCPRPYALDLKHKHLPEMQKFCELKHLPLFCPVIADFYKGMLVTVPLLTRLLPDRCRPADVHAVLADYYRGERFVRVAPFGDAKNLDDGFLSPLDCNDTNRLDLFVFGNEDQTLVVARFDNLGKGASGAAVQCLNLMLGFDEGTGLVA